MGKEIQFLHVGNMMCGRVVEDRLVVGDGGRIGDQEDRIRWVAVHCAEGVGEIVGGAHPEQLGDDAELLRSACAAVQRIAMARSFWFHSSATV